jgi:hypothetical protein
LKELAVWYVGRVKCYIIFSLINVFQFSGTTLHESFELGDEHFVGHVQKQGPETSVTKIGVLGFPGAVDITFASVTEDRRFKSRSFIFKGKNRYINSLYGIDLM